MILSRQPMAAPRKKVTYHRFSHYRLSNNDQTEINWWNPADHSIPFPWRMDAWYAGGPYRSDLESAIPIYTNNTQTLFTASFHQGPSDPTPSNSIALMAVDASGSDLYNLWSPPTTRPERIYGLYVKQTVSHWTVQRDFNPLVLIWSFFDIDGNAIAPES